MKRIKSLLFVLLGLFVLASCSKDDAPTVSFGKNTYVLMPENNLEVVVTLSKVASTDLEIPITIGGSAEKNTDYTLSSEKLTIKAGELNAKIIITPKDNYEEDKLIIINLGSVPGYDMGDNQVTTVSITPKEKVLYTFEKEYSVLENTLDVYINIFNSKGEKITPTKDIHIPFVIDEASTAVAGETYSIVDDLNEFVIPAGEDQGKITLKYIENTETDKNKLVFGVPELGPGFIKGGTLKTTVKVYGSSVSKIFGKWTGVKLANKDYLVNDAVSYGYPSDADNLPENIVGDILVLESGLLDMVKPEMTHDAGNFFRETSMSYIGMESFVYPEERVGFKKPPSYNVYVFKLAKANVSFSKSNESIKEAKVAFRVKEVDGEEILDVTIYDFAPTDFFVNIYSIMTEMSFDPIRYQFKRVN